ncbi:MAG: zinc ribbon domain-containing protein [Armatimonadetes bacterium]|nr:zinc ribbon domain-containing protein [Armatimonadota bacterium]
MPIYEFICRLCEQQFEILTSVSKASEAECPKCGSKELKRLMSMFAVKISGGSSHSDCAGCSADHCGTSACGCAH